MGWFTKLKNACGFGIKTDQDNKSAESVISPPDYSSMKVPELKALAKEKQVKGYYKLRRIDLIKALNNKH